MPFVGSIQYNGLKLYFSFHIGGDDAEFIIDEVQLLDSDTNLLDILSVDVIDRIEKYIGENLGKIVEDNND